MVIFKTCRCHIKFFLILNGISKVFISKWGQGGAGEENNVKLSNEEKCCNWRFF